MSETLSEHVAEGPAVRARAGELTLVRPRMGVVLAAGRSERLAAVTGGGSKALVRVGGLSLVERAVRTLLDAGVERVVVVVGFQAGPVATVVNRIAPERVRAAFAETWELGNGASLAAAEPHVADELGFVLVTTDHLFGDGALAPLLAAGRPAVLVDHTPDPGAWAEGTRVSLHDERAVAFSKQLGDPSIDCGAFLLPPAIFGAQRRAQRRADATLAGAVTELARTQPLDAIPLPRGAWWQDVDTPEDLKLASQRLRRSLTKESDGPVSRYLNRPISTRMSMALAHLPVHPNVLSVIAFLVALAGAWALAFGAAVVGASLVHAASILDGVDGEIARLRIRATAGGALLDGILDRVADAFVLGGLALWALAEGTDPRLVLVTAVAATAGAMLSMAAKDRIAALGLAPPPERWIGFLLGGRDGRLLFVAVAALLAEPFVGLVLIAGTSALGLAARALIVFGMLRAWAARG